ncbi:DUF445 family protein [Limisalsivibrio acetivorans]|uniref:DUF445 family protein n=1 Tax=Limisalsivibrio acetivorans TaxID=1304888 RepID=UPI0003B75506|nr:DUF445 family protein [Limisalsivibrio acetivorans]
MPFLNYSILATPLVTGFVGYVTNWLAIKMLFRPHKRKWYTLGWQGVIPRKRAMLAEKVGGLVGEKLIGEEEIVRAVKSESVQNALASTIESELTDYLSRDWGTVAEILSKLGLPPETLEKKIREILDDERVEAAVKSAIEEIASGAVDRVADMRLSELIGDGENLKSLVENAVKSGRWQGMVINELSNKLNNLVLSGKSIADLLPDKVLSSVPGFSEYITDRGVDFLDKLLQEPETRAKLSKKLVKLKDSLFTGSGFDQLKHGFVNMFLNEDSITDLVNDHLPSLVKSIRQDEALKGKICKGIEDKINEFLKKPLYTHAGNIGFETVYEVRGEYVGMLREYLCSESFVNRITDTVKGMIDEDPDRTVGSAAKSMGFDLSDGSLAKLAADTVISGGSFKEKLPKTIVGMTEKIHIRGLYDHIPKKAFLNIKTKLRDEINTVMEKNVPGMLRAVDLPKIVEQKINTLNLYEVEDLLFDFMKDQFRWINILGFFLGFFFGCVQVLIIHLMG